MLLTGSAAASAAREPPPRGEAIGGLLLLFLVMQGAALLLDLLALRTLPATFRPGTWALGALSPLYRPLVVSEAGARVLSVLLPVAGFSLTFRRSPLAPRVWVGYLAFCVVYGLLEVIGTRLVASQLAVPLLQRGESTGEVERLARDATLTGARTMVYGVFWGAYWLTSERVARTFGPPRTRIPLTVLAVALAAATLGCAQQRAPAAGADSARVAAAIAPSIPESLEARSSATPPAPPPERSAAAPVPIAPAVAPPPATPVPSSPSPSTAPAAPAGADTSAIDATPTELATLAAALVVPVSGVRAADLLDTFNETRDGGTRRHGALDIPAPRGTPVLSAAAGRLLRKFDSKTGGLMVYASDATDRFVLLYGHLDRWADGLVEGQPLARGQVIGYVGTTGNAPPNLPHLHFGIARTRDVARWWTGTPIDPRPLLQGTTPSTR